MSATSKANQITIIKFKRATATYVIPLKFDAKLPLTVYDLKTKLIKAIELCGGLTLVETEKIVLEDDIEVPKSEFLDEEREQPEEDEEEEVVVEDDDRLQIDENVVKNVSIEDIKLAIPQDKSNAYDNKWIEIKTDEELQDLTFNDYDIIAFSYRDLNFEIVEATYDD